MKILILGSVALPVPPPMQGGTERIAYWQAMGLSKLGHDVTLIAAKGSKADSAYRLVEIGGGDTVVGSMQSHVPNSAQFTEGSRNMRKELVYMAQVVQWIIDNKDSYDLIVNNMRGGESILLPIVKLLNKQFVTVMHLPIFTELASLFEQYKTPVITISQAQREGFPNLNYVGTVYNCVDPELANWSNKTYETNRDNSYLLMMGSIAPHKNQKDGILAAKKLGKKIVIAGKIGNQAYWEKEIAPLVDGISVIHKGEMGLAEKASLLGGAEALLFPIVWPEPFGLVMIEAMACGTPVIAYNNGAVSEVVADGVTGFIIDEETHESHESYESNKSNFIIQKTGISGLVEAIKRIGEIDRVDCRIYVEENFTIEKMVDSLEMALEKVASLYVSQ